jgi:hypothetical protein
VAAITNQVVVTDGGHGDRGVHLSVLSVNKKSARDARVRAHARPRSAHYAAMCDRAFL